MVLSFLLVEYLNEFPLGCGSWYCKGVFNVIVYLYASDFFYSKCRSIHPSPLSDKDQEEKAQRCKFIQGLVLSTILDDGL